MDHRVRFLKGLSTELTLPERVDVVVSEIIGSFGLEEGVLRYLVDARKRLLKSGGCLLPRELELILVPSEDRTIQDRLGVWARTEAMYGVNFLPARRLAVEYMYEVGADPGDFLAEPACLERINLSAVRDIHMRGRAHFEATRAGRLTGLAGWFRAKLTEDIWLSTEPPLKGSSWENVFFPLERPCDVYPGDRIDATVSYLDPFWKWTVEVVSTSGARSVRYTHSTFRGVPPSTKNTVRRLISCIPLLSGPARTQLEVAARALYRFGRVIVG